MRVPYHLSTHGAEQKGTEAAVATGTDNDEVGSMGQLQQDGGRLSFDQLALYLHRRRAANRFDNAGKTSPCLLLDDGGIER